MGALIRLVTTVVSVAFKLVAGVAESVVDLLTHDERR